MKYIKRLLGFLIDATACFFIYLIVAFIMSYFVFLPFFRSFFLIWVIYYIICYLKWKRTLGQAIINYGIYDNGGKKSYPVRIVLKEGLTSIPAVILLIFGWQDLSIVRTLLMIIICLVLVIFRRKLFKISMVRKENLSPSIRKAVWTYMLLFVLAIFARGLNTVFTFNHFKEDRSNLYATPRPSTNSVREYINFLTKYLVKIN